MTRRTTALLVGGAMLLAGAVTGLWFATTGSDPATSTAGGAAAPSGAAGNGGAGGGTATTGTASPSGGPTPRAGDTGTGAGQIRPRSTDPVRDGDLELAVTAVQTGVDRLGAEPVRRPLGEFVLVTVRVRNRAGAAASFDIGGQYLYDDQGRQFDADEDAGVYLDRSRPLLDPIGPGDEVSGVLVFDLPKRAVLASVELHGRAAGDGVAVALV